MLSPYFLDATTEAYLRTLLQTERPDSEGEDGVTPEAYDIAPLSPALRDTAATDVFRFTSASLHLLAAPLMDGTVSLDRVGHDFALTRNGHGAGFWDSPTEYGSQANADALTRTADTFPEVNVYMGDDGHLYT